MINNRQGGRRRGRGGQRERGPNLGGQPGNRQDNRQRGNAAQLLEKYKSMARDAQLAGDRVQSEYYLQFADHYFRVLGESRARFEDQRPRRDQDTDEDEGDEEMVEAGDDGAGDERAERPERQDRSERFDRDRRPRRDDRDEQGGRQAADAEPGQVNGAGETIPFDVLPPAIGRNDSEAEETAEEEPRRPRRRTRTPRAADDDGEIAPAA
ncbi:MAG: hypothetical protein QOK41_1336 [Sphingomonadales bacterium]|nr:hypothetical protein [Sphingomonadales bacterium]